MRFKLSCYPTPLALALLAALAPGCKNDDADDLAAETETSSGDGDGDGDSGDGDPGDGDGDDPLPDTASLTHEFGPRSLTPFEETEPCVQWTLDNDEPLYVQAVTLSNLGYSRRDRPHRLPGRMRCVRAPEPGFLPDAVREGPLGDARSRSWDGRLFAARRLARRPENHHRLSCWRLSR
jgi:hypothetical protein